MKKEGFTRDLIYSQAALYLTLLVCILLAPASLGANSGFSYFGHYGRTIAPFAIGFFISAYYLWRAREYFRSLSEFSVIYKGLSVIVPGMIGIIIAPAVGNGTLDILHRIFGSIVFITELIMAAWMVIKFRSDIINWLFYGLQFAGGLIAAYYLSPPQGFSFEGQLLFQLAFSAILFRTLVWRESKARLKVQK